MINLKSTRAQKNGWTFVWEKTMRYYMLNKPGGYVCANSDSLQKTVTELFPKEERSGLHTIGRLDIDTEGLLLLTDDGDFTSKLTRPEYGIEKRYFLRAFGEMNSEKINFILGGAKLYGNEKNARPAVLSDIVLSTVENDFEHIPLKIRSRAIKNPKGKTFSAIITVIEGKRHEVKLLMRAVGCKVFYLKRLSMGKFTLDSALSLGEFRKLDFEELTYVNEYKKLFVKF